MRRQATACADLGSPMYADLLTRVAGDLERNGVSSEVLRGHEDDPGPSALGLRLMGSVHRLVLDGTAADLAGFYPSAGGRWRPQEAWTAFTRTLGDHLDDVRARLVQPPQTNEVGRAAALMGGLQILHAERPLPVRLREIGASAGLNLSADQFCYVDATGHRHGRTDSPVVLDGAWTGRRLPPTEVAVLDRVGCDLAPLDVGDQDARLSLMSYVWPDQVARFARLRAALEVAGAVPAPVRAQGAREFVDGLDLADGARTVLWHSVMWQYLSREDQEAVTARVARLGAEATPERAFAHLFLEPTRRSPDDEHEFLVVLRSWPGGERRVLGHAAPHGIPTTWE